MRIGIDARAWRWEGIGRYIRSLLPEIVGLGRGHEYVVAVGREDFEVVRQELAGLTGDAVRAVPVEGSYYSWQEQVLLPRQLSRLGADLWHFAHFNMPIWWQAPYVVTIHDVIRFVFPGEYQQSLYQQVAYEYIFQRAVTRARAIITVSQATRHDLLELPMRPPPPAGGQRGGGPRVVTIHEGVAERFWQPASLEARARVRQQFGTSAPYLLFVGVAMNHKNLPRVLAAFRNVRQRHPAMRLVLAGRHKQGREKLEQHVQRLGVADAVTMLGFVPEALLPALYAEATALVFPSLYEGFGLPALEAQAAGIPVVAANVTSLPELLGNAAVYVNPESVQDIARGIERVVNEAALRSASWWRLVQTGREQARRFSWRAAAERHVAVYEQAMSVKNSSLSA